jgi:hypothetical protein
VRDKLVNVKPPLLYVVSPEADEVNGWRFDANLCDLVFATVGSRPSMEWPPKVRFAPDSALERAGFEPSVPREGNYAH